MKKVDLPDFDDMIKLASEIGQKKTNIMMKESRLDLILAKITQLVSSNADYFINGKAPSNAHIKDTYHVVGLNEEQETALMELRDEIATLTGDLKSDESLFKVYENMIDVWRTQSADERKAYLE